ncbi:MAG: hypothetical protein KAW17_10820 [Candidatus Eisenbacteria sp.]|nr:hypothetical protein [Candidatus Eisenbacteria bacterium]
MTNRIGIRLEDNSEWDRRVALTPSDVADLTAHGVEIWVECSAHRIFTDANPVLRHFSSLARHL